MKIDGCLDCKWKAHGFKVLYNDPYFVIYADLKKEESYIHYREHEEPSEMLWSHIKSIAESLVFINPKYIRLETEHPIWRVE